MERPKTPMSASDPAWIAYNKFMGKTANRKKTKEEQETIKLLLSVFGGKII